LKSVFGVIQGHWKWCGSIHHVWLSIGPQYKYHANKFLKCPTCLECCDGTKNYCNYLVPFSSYL